MTHADFVHLHIHSAYSLSEGAIRIPQMVDFCVAQNMPAMAVTDTNNLFGALEYSLACAKAGIQPIVGCQVALLRPEDDRRNGAPPAADPIVLLAQNEQGYANLLALISAAYLEGDAGVDPQVSEDALERHNAGLILLTGGPYGPIGHFLAKGQADAAEAILSRLAKLFPGRLYVELQRHGTDRENEIEPSLLALAYRHELPLIATNEPYFRDRDMFEAHDALLCIAEGSYVSQTDRRQLTPEHYLKSAEEMRALFGDVPEALVNTLVVAQRCAFMVEPRAPLLPTAGNVADGGDEEGAVRRLAVEGLERRLETHVFTDDLDRAAREVAARPYREQLDYELDVIVQMGFAGYFLIVAEFIQFAKREGIAVGPGRGSGAGSLVAWALSITDLNPLQFGLLFERFLNPERVSMPDFDIDFCQERRDEVIRHVQEEYGRDRVAQIITFGKLQARAVLRDVGRVLQMPYGQVDRLCKMVPNNPANPVSLAEAIDGEPRLQEERQQDDTVARLLDYALKLEGLYRHASTHAAGVVIGDRPLQELVPLYRDPRSDMPVTQFNMKYVEQAGLVKFDFLGLKTLTVLEHACRLVRSRGQEIDLSTVPLDDQDTFDLMTSGETVGVFQFESTGMRSLLREAHVDSFEDIIALVALYRPGPMENIPKYIACKHGREQPEFLHETIEPVVKDTYGVIIYQEQVMQIAQVFAGYTLGQADLLRRAMGKKIKAEMDAQRGTFIDGAVARGVDKDRARYVFDLVDKFAGYGFNKAHSAGYGLVAYHTAYMKAHYPVEFLAALMTLDQGNTDKLNIYKQELDRLGIALMPPEINSSGVDFEVEGIDEDKRVIRYGLAAIKNVGGAAMRQVLEERKTKGPFKDIFDFAARSGGGLMNKRQFENLAKAGGFDTLNPNRAQMFESVDILLRYGNATIEERTSDQSSLFGDVLDEQLTPPLPVVADWPMFDRLSNEFEAIGFYLSAHPLHAYEKSLEELGVLSYTQVMAGTMIDGVHMAGIVLSVRERRSARGRYAFVQMSDASGMYEVAVFSDVFERARDLLNVGQTLYLEVGVQRDEEQVRIMARRVTRLDEKAADLIKGLKVFVADGVAISALKSVIDRGGRGSGQLRLVVRLPLDEEAEIALSGRFAVSPAARAALKAVPGVIDVHDL